MNTNDIKSFAREARLILIEGVFQRLKYWGFQEDGTNTENLQTTQGGYIFRTNPYTDITVPTKWHKLKAKLKNKQDVKDILEEAGYTWFNRLMAVKILEANGYIPKQLAYTQGSRTPLIVQNAKRGEHNITNRAEKELLIEYLKEDKDEEAFALLITNLCHTNKLLHDIFGRIDDYTEILFPQHSLQINGLLDLINSDAISEDDYKEVELIGWLYQFYISDKKDEVFKGFKKNIKARAEDIPAATQIFTPKWIVKYMVENTVGKIYLDYEPDSSLKEDMKYLVENDSDTAVSSSAVEHKALINDLEQLTLIDPAVGSGHILVTGFELYMKMYREAGYTAKQAVQNILQHNLFGLDIDDRAMQLARFAVLLKAAHYDTSIIEEPLMPNVYSFPEDTLGNCFTQAYYSQSQSNWHDLLGMQLVAPISMEWAETKKGKTKTKKIIYKKGDSLNEAMVDLLKLHCKDAIAIDYSQELELFWGDYEKPHNYSEFFYAIKLLRQSKNLGSAIKLNISREVYNHINETYHNWLLKESTAQLDLEETSIFNLLKPFLEVFLVLAKQYKAVVANPPYMGQKSMNAELKDYVNKHYPDTKNDLMTIFMEVIPNLTADDSRFALINLPSWLFLSSFEKIRTGYINQFTFDSLLHMGRGIFGIDFGSVAFAMKKTASNSAVGSYFRLHERNFQHILYQDIEKLFLYSNGKTGYKYNFNQYRGDEGITEIPEEGTITGQKLFYPNIRQANFTKIPGCTIGYWVNDVAISIFDRKDKVGEITNPRKGMVTGDNSSFTKLWHEISLKKFGLKYSNRLDAQKSNFKWFPYKKGGDFRKWYGNNEYVVNWENDGKLIRSTMHPNGLRPISSNYNLDFIFKSNISWSAVSAGGFGARYSEEGFLCDAGGSACYPDSEITVDLLGYFNSIVSQYFLSIYNPTINYQAGNISNLPFISVNNNKLIEYSNHSVFLSKKDWNSRETSWGFKLSPLINVGNTLKEAYGVWKDNVTQDFFQLHANEEELNRIFIDIYGLQDELTPTVALKDITILQEELKKSDLEVLESTFREKGQNAICLPINKTEVVSQFISYCIGIFLGRYRLDKPGLNIAHPNPTDQELASYNIIARNEAISRKITIDDDGIVPLMGEDCTFPDDALTRTEDLLLAIWGEDALTENINFLQESLGLKLHKFLTEKFWKYHTSMYKKKPIYWLFSSNVKKPQQAAFKVLVYMHRMDKYTVQQIQRSYLYPHQEYIKNEKDKLERDEDSLDREQQKRLELMRDWELECRDYNEVLKALANQQIEIDLDDGVTVNYAKFEGAVAII
ncbi:BREX-1 system adenine-specific DNA-methyltransferase PglX [Winogradskyella sp. UBA3174]|uniref:BREX-1 system adenine-specific DNA-methyltransferase PglX n=1 Tax=Winogradskyella sp. UBA3174 TaxID=1947785 RepID=UPI0025EC6954|nr:BREX-1 system adenine-specific DNA-methyltransferase PglX [Winogradskyella sp. UBA3174]|tara:strand:- start:121039 stop:124947 length:3909 start_codon:yes stop_codon:yes gene_type:complete